MKMSRRRKQNAVPNAKDRRIAELEEKLAQVLELNQRLQKELERLQAEVEELKRAGKRQAAPFARRHWVEHPKRAGRKRGQGKFARRAMPQIQQIKETKVAKLYG